MAFLILTRRGFDDIESTTVLSGLALYLNPALLSEDELARLRSKGARIQVFPSRVDPDDVLAVRTATDQVAHDTGTTVWVERASAVSEASHARGMNAEDVPASPPIDIVHPALHQRFVQNVGKFAGQALRQLGKHIGPRSALTIIPFLGFGNAQRLTVRGRVLKDEGFKSQTRDDSRWSNLIELYKRLESDEIVGAGVRARFQNVEQETTTDDGGYFSFEIDLATPLTTSGWHTVELELTEPPPAGSHAVTVKAEVLVPPATARFGIISDIDDTVLWTNVTNKLNMMLMLAGSNAHTRKPFKGVAAFYRALRDGPDGGENNPVFYVSSSPWHLFAPLVEFLKLQGIPVGPLLLKELGVRQVFGSGMHSTHKLAKIESILRLYPTMQFILIGDSGEQDPEIYADVLKRHPQAVRVIYIRSVNPDPARIDAIDQLIDAVSATGTQLILAPDSVFAATHAAAEGLIAVADVAAVRTNMRQDETSTRVDVP